MAKRRANRPDEGQGDLFARDALFPVRRPTRSMRPVDLSLRIKTAMGQALKECADSAAVVAATIQGTSEVSIPMGGNKKKGANPCGWRPV